MSDASAAPKGKKQDEELDFDALATREKEKLTKQREEVLAQRERLDEQLASIDGKIAKLDNYLNPAATREPAPRAARQRKASTGTRAPRRSGVRETVLAEIKKHADGINRKDLLKALEAAGIDEAAMNNAVSALKKQPAKISADKGHYKAF